MVRKKLTDEEIQEQVNKFETIEEALDWLRFIEQGGDPTAYGTGSIVCLEGRLGRGGSTLFSVALAYNEHKKTGLPVYSNLQLNFPSKPLSKINFGTSVSSIILIDDAYMEFEARRSNTKTNILWSWFLAQSRKRGLRVFLSTPDIMYLDPRVRRMISIRGTCYWRGDICTARLLDLSTGTTQLLSISRKSFDKLYNQSFITRPTMLKKG